MGKLSNRAENDTFLGTGSELGICRRGAWRISSSFTCHVTCFFYIFFSRYLFCLSPPSGRSSLFICDRHLMVSCNPHHSRTHRTLIINRAWWTRKTRRVSLRTDDWDLMRLLRFIHAICLASGTEKLYTLRLPCDERMRANVQFSTMGQVEHE